MSGLYLGGLEDRVDQHVDVLMLPPLQGLGVDEEEQVGDPKQGEQDQGGAHCLANLC